MKNILLCILLIFLLTCPAFAGIPATGVMLDKSSTIIHINNSDESHDTISPTNATNQNVTWNSSNSDIATISTSGLVTAASLGSATITARTEDGDHIATCVIEIPITLPDLTLTPSTASIQEGDIVQLVATVIPATTITWQSNNTTVATVNTSGLVAGISAGTATITVRREDNGNTATCEINVVPSIITLPDLTLTPSTASIQEGDIVQLVATVIPATTITWQSNNTTVATVNTSGLVTGISAGTAIITIRREDNGLTATCEINVTGNPGSIKRGSGGCNILNYGMLCFASMFIYLRQSKSQVV